MVLQEYVFHILGQELFLAVLSFLGVGHKRLQIRVDKSIVQLVNDDNRSRLVTLFV